MRSPGRAPASSATTGWPGTSLRVTSDAMLLRQLLVGPGRGRDDERAADVSGELQADRAEPEPGESPSAARADHDQRGAPRLVQDERHWRGHCQPVADNKAWGDLVGALDRGIEQLVSGFPEMSLRP
jgi:hypothetical protein